MGCAREGLQASAFETEELKNVDQGRYLPVDGNRAKGPNDGRPVGKPPQRQRRQGQFTDAVGCGETQSRRARKTSVPLVPPKPKEFDTATSIFIGRAVLGT